MPNPDPFNKFMVSVQGERIIMMVPPVRSISKDEAIMLAAWLVVLADDRDRTQFAEAVKAVMNT